MNTNKKDALLMIFSMLMFIIISNSIVMSCQDTENNSFLSPTTSKYEYGDSVASGNCIDDSMSIYGEASSAVWGEMTRCSQGETRQEVGCYLYQHKITGETRMGSFKYGDPVSGDVGTSASIVPGAGNPSKNGFSSSADDANWEILAFIHSHTTVANMPSYCSREVGPSPGDETWASSQGIPVLTVDYVGVDDGSGVRMANGGTNGETTMYVSCP